MNSTYRIFALATGIAICLSAEEVRKVEKKPVDRTTSASKVIDPGGQIKSKVDVKKHFDDARDPTKGNKDVKSTEKSGGKDFSKKGTLTGVFNGTEKKKPLEKPEPKPKPPSGPKP